MLRARASSQDADQKTHSNERTTTTVSFNAACTWSRVQISGVDKRAACGAASLVVRSFFFFVCSDDSDVDDDDEDPALICV